MSSRTRRVGHCRRNIATVVFALAAVSWTAVATASTLSSLPGGGVLTSTTAAATLGGVNSVDDGGWNLAAPRPDATFRKVVAMKAFQDEATIFVNLASFRDPLCPVTLNEMYERAINPRRVFVGVIQQNTEEEPDCVLRQWHFCMPLAFCPKDNIRVRKWPPALALGPTFGRFVAGLLYRTERYYMMIDSHNRFLKHWDRVTLVMYLRTPGTKKVLSHYPNGYEADKPGGNIDMNGMMVMCYAFWIPDFNITRNKVVVMRPNGYTRLQPFTAAGFLFTDSQAIDEVPFDPHLDFLFDGEEVLFSVRLWTHGYDLYCPASPVLFHSYDRHTAKRFWHETGNKWQERQKVSQLRLKRIMKLVYPNTTQLMVPLDMDVPPRVVREIDKYGLGKERTIEKYWAFAMIDPVKQTNGREYCDTLPQ